MNDMHLLYNRQKVGYFKKNKKLQINEINTALLFVQSSIALLFWKQQKIKILSKLFLQRKLNT